LIQRFQAGEERAFDLLIELWGPPMLSFIRRHVTDDFFAIEIYAEFRRKVCKGLRNYKDAGLSSWLFKIARNAICDHLRRIGRTPTLSLDSDDTFEELPATEPEPEQILLQTRLIDCIRDKLSAEQWQILQMDAEGWSDDEIASMLGSNLRRITNQKASARIKANKLVSDGKC